MAGATANHVNAAVAGLDGSACGELLIALGEVQDRDRNGPQFPRQRGSQRYDR
jgi:hypothetical protein